MMKITTYFYIQSLFKCFIKEKIITTGSVLKIENVVGKVKSGETLTDNVNGQIIMSGGGNTASDQMQAGKNGAVSTGNGNVHGKGSCS